MGEQHPGNEYIVETPDDEMSEQCLDSVTTTPSELELEPDEPDPRSLITNCYEQLNYPASTIQNLHLQVARKPIPEGKTDYQGMLEKVAVWNSPEVTHRILCSLMRHFEATDTRVARFRASIIFSLTNDECAWPVVEWKEEDDTEAIAIFYVDETAPSDVCSWLMHYGRGILEDSKEGMRWEKTSIAWSVGDMDHLKSLFKAAQHLLGILKWPTEDMLRLYCKTEGGPLLPEK
jgi:hypothetical protein